MTAVALAKVRYQPLDPISRDEYQRVFAGPSPDDAAEALIRLAWHERDHAWAERECSRALDDFRVEVRRAAGTALAHVARLQRGLTPDTVKRLTELRDDPHVGGYVQDALDDLRTFGGIVGDD